MWKFIPKEIKNKYFILKRKFSSLFPEEKTFLVLGIETSCDDTGIALLNSKGKIISQVKKSYWDILRRDWGGINPIIAKNNHLLNINNCLNECLEKANLQINDIDVVAVTRGPGIALCLSVGMDLAKKIVSNHPKSKLIGINHLEAHILSCRLDHNVQFPFLCLLASGGNCQLVLVEAIGDYTILGYTKDDAPGEAFDKIARSFGLSNGKSIEDIVGGVAANVSLRSEMARLSQHYSLDFYSPPIDLCTDNGVMIAWTAIEKIKAGKYEDLSLLVNDSILSYSKWPLGPDEAEEIAKKRIKLASMNASLTKFYSLRKANATSFE